jgi:hypothetical protein
MSQMTVSAAALINEDTQITYMTCGNGATEFTFNHADLTLEVTEKGLVKLVDAVNGALEDLRSFRQTDR